MSGNRERAPLNSRHGHHVSPPTGPVHARMASSLIGGTPGAPSYAFVQHQVHHPFSRQEGLPVRQENEEATGAISPVPSVQCQRPPGIYPNDVNVIRRPPMILEDTIKEFKERVSLGSGTTSKGRGKDIHRHLRVVHVIGEFVREHNELNREDPYMQYRWYGTDRTDSQITANLLAIIEDNAFAIIPHLYSRFTYSDAQKRDGASMELLVARVSSDEMSDPLTQTLRAFGIRRLIQEKMANKKKTTNRRQKRFGLGDRTNEFPLDRPLSVVPASDEAVATVPDLPAETHVAPRAFESSIPTDVGGVGGAPHITPVLACSSKTQNIGISDHEAQPAQKNASLPFPVHREDEERGKVSVLKEPTNASSPAARSHADKTSNKPRRNKGKKTASKPPKLFSKSGAISKKKPLKEGQKVVSERRKSVASHASSSRKSRKHIQVESESSESDSMTDNTDNEDHETELAELKKRMREIEKRSAKKKAKKNRCRK